MMIYAIRNTANGKMYIGQTVQLKRRWAEHKRNLRRNQHDNVHLQAAWNKYGEAAFAFEVITSCTSLDQLNIEENMYIALYNTTNKRHGYNKRLGSLQTPLLDEQKQKIGAALRGRVCSTEHKERVRQSKLGKKRCLADRQKMSANRPKKKFSVMHPNGMIEHTENINQFCKLHNLNVGAFSRLLKGELKQHKGFRSLSEQSMICH